MSECGDRARCRRSPHPGDQLQRDASLSNLELAAAVHTSAATCLRRVKRLTDAGVIERRVAVLSPARLGTGLTAIVEVSLDRQGAEHLTAFEGRALERTEVQQCYRVSPGPGPDPGAAGARHARLARAGAGPVHAGCQRAQREVVFQRAPVAIRDPACCCRNGRRHRDRCVTRALRARPIRGLRRTSDARIHLSSPRFDGCRHALAGRGGRIGGPAERFNNASPLR